MDTLTARRRRLAPWVIAVLAVIVNLPVADHLLTQRSLDRDGIVVQAELVDTAVFGEGPDASYSVAFRFGETLDPRQTIWSSPVDRITFQRAVDTDVVEARVLPDEPGAFRIDGAITSHLGFYLTGIVDVVLLVALLLLRRPTRSRVPALPARGSGVLVVDALEDVQRLIPGTGPQTGFDDLGAATYLITGEVTRIDPDTVVLDAGSREVHVRLGTHANLVGFQQPGRVRARLSPRLSE